MEKSMKNDKEERLKHVALQRLRMTCSVYLHGWQSLNKCVCDKGCMACPRLDRELYELKKEIIEDKIAELRNELRKLEQGKRDE